MMTVTEILTAIYNPAVWEVIDGLGNYCVFCGASDGRERWERGGIHHYAGCLLRQIRIHLATQACASRRLSEAALLTVRELAAHLVPGLTTVADDLIRAMDRDLAGGPPPGASSKPDPELTAAAQAVPEAEVYLTARAVPEVAPEVEPERLHSWQSMPSGKAARCLTCGLVTLPGISVLSVCPGRNPDLPAPAEVKSVTPAGPLVKVMCPRCGVFEIIPATGGALPDLPQITPGGSFMVVSWAHPAHGRQTGVYCKACWSDTTASLITAILQPAVLCQPARVGGPDPGKPA